MIEAKKDRKDPEVRKERYKDYLCPECGEPPEIIAKCMKRNAKCKNGHWWHKCEVHHTIVPVEAHPMQKGCTCLVPPEKLELVVEGEEPQEKPEDRYKDIHRRIGKFEISQAFLMDNPKDVIRSMEGVLVVRCEMMWMRRVFEYHAISPHFDVTPEGEIPPTYVCEFTRHEDGTVTWEWKQSKEQWEWKKMEVSSD